MTNSPLFPELKPVTIEDRALFTEYFSRFPAEACELTFANIFIETALHDTDAQSLAGQIRFDFANVHQALSPARVK